MNLISLLGGAFFTNVLGDVKEVVLAVVNKKVKVEELDVKLKEILIKNGSQVTQELAKVQGNVVQAEVASDSWLTKNWRPLAMVWAMVLVTVLIFMFPSEANLDKLFDLLTIGIGGYVVGRSAEKITDKLKR